MRLDEAAPKLNIQERVGDRIKLLSYCPVASLTRAGPALGRLHHALRQNGRPCPWRALRSCRTGTILMRIFPALPPVCPSGGGQTWRLGVAPSTPRFSGA